MSDTFILEEPEDLSPETHKTRMTKELDRLLNELESSQDKYDLSDREFYCSDARKLGKEIGDEVTELAMDLRSELEKSYGIIYIEEDEELLVELQDGSSPRASPAGERL